MFNIPQHSPTTKTRSRYTKQGRRTSKAKSIIKESRQNERRSYSTAVDQVMPLTARMQEIERKQ